MRPVPTKRSDRRGFTLVELLAVVSLMALLSGAALVSVRYPIQKASRQAMVERIRFIDSTARKLARGGDPVALVFDLSNGFVELQTAAPAGVLRSEIPPGVQLHVRGIDNPRLVRDSPDDRVAVPFDRHGTSYDYAVEVLDRFGHGSWLVVFGLTGQAEVVPNENDVWEMIAR